MITNKYAFPAVILYTSLAMLPALAQNSPVTTGDPFFPLPEVADLDPDKIALGKKLFYDTRLSENGQYACATCHQLEHGGDSGNTKDESHGFTALSINTPSIFNSRYNFRQNWSGSDRTLREQLVKTFDRHSPFDTSLETVVERLRQDPALRTDFNTLYREGLTPDTLVDSLVEFEKSLVTPNSRFDQYLQGKHEALDDDELAGYELFKNLGCVSCHQGVNIGGNLFQRFGVFYNYIAERGETTRADYGRINNTGREMDRFVFKVPSLRNIEVTAPYLHDGSAKTIEEAIFVVGKTQLGRKLDSEEIYLLKAFLLTLTGEYNNNPLSAVAND